MPHAIVTALGTDRPGLVDEASRFIFDQGGNIEDSRMVNLRGQFAMMLLVAGNEQTLAKLREGLPRFAQSSGLHAELRPVQETPAALGGALIYRLVATSIDQPGIVHRVSHTLGRMQVNIESLQTRLTPAPYTGAPLFEMELTLSVPRSVAFAQLRQNLGATCDAMNIDWELRPI
jgi:glycine cleavage system transcriptional repressor